MYDDLLTEYKNLYKETKAIFDSFPKEKRKDILFNKWSLKDVVAHLNHWAVHDLVCFKALKEGKEPYWAPDVDKYNEEGVESRKSKVWDEVYSEFNILLNDVIAEFENLPEDMWHKRFWIDRDFTPLKFLEIDIDHYKNEHLPELRKCLDKLMA